MAAGAQPRLLPWWDWGSLAQAPQFDGKAAGSHPGVGLSQFATGAHKRRRVVVGVRGNEVASDLAWSHCAPLLKSRGIAGSIAIYKW
jgi:hypothetical protein